MIPSPRLRPVRGLFAVVVATVVASPLVAQDPDSVVVANPPIPDSLAVDTLDVVGDSLAVPADTIAVADTARIFRRVPGLPGDVPAPEFRGGALWHWTRDDLLGRPHFTLLELLVADVPGLVPLRQGDYGTPESLVLDGMNGSRVRVFFDGMEEIGLVGSSPDLSRIALVGLESVTVRRVGGELRIELEPLQADEARPLSMIEAGTGDLDTNIFRGTFIQGDALGGALGLGIERVDTQGRGTNEPGSRQGVWLRYMRPVGDRLTLVGEFRRGISEQTVDRGPDRLQRHASVLRARWQASPSVLAEVYAARNSLRETEDSISPLAPRTTQIGARAGWSGASGFGRAEVRRFGGDLPSLRIDADAGWTLPEVGTATAHVSRESFDGETASLWGIGVETRPLYGLSLFGAKESGDRGWRGLADTTTVVEPDTTSTEPVEPTEPYMVPTAIGSRDATRYGVRWSGFGLTASYAKLRTEVDSVRPVATFLDGEGMAFAGDVAEGWEARMRWYLPRRPWMNGFYLDGSLQRWDTPGVYRPEEVYTAGVGFHRTYLESGNFELWAGLMVEGRSAMMLPLADTGAEVEEGSPFPPVTVPFQQSWNAWLQFRVVTVRIFLRFENVSVRPFNQDFPGRLLPQTRAMYGVRWTLWN